MCHLSVTFFTTNNNFILFTDYEMYPEDSIKWKKKYEMTSILDILNEQKKRSCRDMVSTKQLKKCNDIKLNVYSGLFKL